VTLQEKILEMIFIKNIQPTDHKHLMI